MRRRGWAVWGGAGLLAALLGCQTGGTQGASAQGGGALPAIETTVSGAQSFPGFVPFYFDARTGKLWLEISRLDEDLLYVTSLPGGLGSNDLELDRGQLGPSRVVRFRRSGAKVLLEQRNLAYRAQSENPAEVRATDDAFARSVLAGFAVVAQTQDRVLIDASEFLLEDAHGVGARLKEREQGEFKVDPKRSALALDGLRGFPRNTVLEAWITLTGSQPGAQLRSVTPTPTAVTLRMRHEFVELPQAPFERRPHHPRSGYFPLTYRDYASPLEQPLERKLLVRHRLRPGEPLVYYVDSGAPEPVRSALLEGARWWAQAFEAAGHPGGFEVRLLPADADPLDLRYNVIQWVHRSTRGWSYGASVVDPRSGEILKGHVTLGSLRVRQDILIAEGLTAPYASGGESGAEQQALALARIRQLSAHEIGHTLGLAHNFAAQQDSVMDYPHPFVRLAEGGAVVLDGAYATAIGEWDKLAIEYGYRSFASDAERARGLAQILDRAQEKGLRFLSDPDARGFGTAHASAHLWDNGGDALVRFDEMLAVRRAALQRFSPQVLRSGRGLSELERVLVPVYLSHRYQAEAAAKALGGFEYEHRLRGEDGSIVPVPATRQARALQQLVGALGDDALALPASLLPLLMPPEYGSARDRESFAHPTGASFDPAAPARAAAQLIAELLLQPSRAQRLLAQQAADASQPGLGGVLDALCAATLLRAPGRGLAGYLASERNWVVLRELQRLSLEPSASDSVRATARGQLERLQPQLARLGTQGRAMAQEIARLFEEPDAKTLPPRIAVPPGAPI